MSCHCSQIAIEIAQHKTQIANSISWACPQRASARYNRHHMPLRLWIAIKYIIQEYGAIGIFSVTYTGTISSENRRGIFGKHTIPPSSPSMLAPSLEWMDCIIPFFLYTESRRKEGDVLKLLPYILFFNIFYRN